ncbi:hypothetical protein KAFR_0B04680 [Kazachstania africana CBS 2517]|uniref:Mediator of RNA polymerase II transcription subunit 5 n=1 Tax=Kazachstania africana (strain ATCC 22294 / BCRC 22015 / CBS 2517 / CECT 1963 / NBRC 1671 / NRRL Y-8276) TaxID=1071382 RepID=H2AQW5_KAZAF|nr:hypothetical protein KAFR_0B04680 [Kazachstania africana CBS 2517]CCF56765.1 hypothetical protein KAFR_0B04680 [Kazachstania africana CBS 2517]
MQHFYIIAINSGLHILDIFWPKLLLRRFDLKLQTHTEARSSIVRIAHDTMTVSIEHESIYSLGIKCEERDIPSIEFLNLYKEFYNEKFSQNIENEESDSNINTEAEVASVISDDFIKLLNSRKSLILADYAVEVLFVNYNSTLIEAFMPKLNLIDESMMLIHFLSKICLFFTKLTDRLVIDQLNKDLSQIIIPSILNADTNTSSNELIVCLCKVLQASIKFSASPIVISSNSSRESFHSLMNRLSKINRLLYKTMQHSVDMKLLFKGAGHFPKDTTREFVNSPTITSPNFVASPLSTMKTPMSSSAGSISVVKYKDMKLLRYYKNLWLNNKLLKWEPVDSDFLMRYASISGTLFQETAASLQNSDAILTDLIETSFTCFAQFVSNKQYHQTNANMNVLERQWIIFISKHLPLLILEHSSRNPQVVTNAMEKIDAKVIKVIRNYYSEKDDMKNRNEDLFDDFSSTCFDLRHDFIKSLIMLKLQPASYINEFLRDDQVVDPNSLPISDDLIIVTAQGVQETVHDIPSFVSQSIDSLELQMIIRPKTESYSNGLYQVLCSFESIPPTQQRKISKTILDLLTNSIEVQNYGRIAKIYGILFFNFSHSLTYVLSFCSPKMFAEVTMKFIDFSQQNTELTKKEPSEDSEEYNNISLSLSWALLLLILLVQDYNVSLRDVAYISNELTINNSFSISFISSLSDIPDDYKINNNQQFNLDSVKLIQNWLSDLFINGSISDTLLQKTDVKQLSTLIPFIFKQVMLALEIGFVTDINQIVGGLEYFLQPFMLASLIKISYWLEQYLLYLKDDKNKEKLLDMVFVILNSLFNPNTLNEDSQAFHVAVLKINAVSLLKTFRKFGTPKQSSYGVYSSDLQEQPALNSIINKLVSVLNVSPFYNVDQRVINSENMYSERKPLGYHEFLIVNENPINKIMTNQINSFWNLHSSTYYNLDYLREVINIVTPKVFLYDVLQTLDYKLTTYGVPAARNKMAAIESDHVFDYFFYFLVLYDCESHVEALNMIRLFEDENEGNITGTDYAALQKDEKNIPQLEEPQVKQDADDDFDMLFGENDTSTHVPDEDLKIISLEHESKNQKLKNLYISKRDSFGIIIHEARKSKETAFKDGIITKEEYERFFRYYKKYLSALKNVCILNKLLT